jgi:hypothetical protein
MADIRAALKEEIARLEAKAAKLKEALAMVESADGAPRRKKFTMSAEAKAKIAAAQKKRWKVLKSKKGAA